IYARLSCLRLVAARHIFTVAIWHWRSGLVGVLLGRSSSRCRPAMVAGSTAWPHRIRQLSISVASSFAGNALLISPGELISDGLLQPGDCESDFPTDFVDYGRIIPFKNRLLEKAWTNFNSGARKDLRSEFGTFCADQANWLEDYALFRALKAKYRGAYYLDWPAKLVQRRPDAIAQAQRELATQIDQVRFAKFLLSRQADQLKEHAHAKGVGLIGDLPFFVSPDSSDVWANPEFFLLDEERRPRFVAGVPPDYFSPRGQLWGILYLTGMRFVRPVIAGASSA